MKNDILNRVDSIMLEQLETLNKLNVTDKEFKNVKEKAKDMSIVADKLIQSQIAQLKFDIWNVSKNIKTYNSKSNNFNNLEYNENDEYLLE